MDILIVNSTNIYTLLLACRMADNSIGDIKALENDVISDTDRAFLKRFIFEDKNKQELKHVKVLLSVVNMLGKSDTDVLELYKLISKDGTIVIHDKLIVNRMFIRTNLKLILESQVSHDFLKRLVPQSYQYLIEEESNEN